MKTINLSDFSEFNHIPISFKNIYKNNEEYILLLDYLNQMDNTEKQSMLIASDHLGSSFNIFKSNGFLKWRQGK